MKITTIVNYCSNEFQFIKDVVKSVAPFSSDVFVVMSDHLFSGEKETEEAIQSATTAVHSGAPGADLIVFEYDHNITLANGTRYWHNMCRWIGVNQMSKDTDYVLFIDADEEADSKKFLEWLSIHGDTPLPQTLKFANYFYFREKKYQAKVWEDSILLAANDSYLYNPNVMFAMERDSIFSAGLTQARNIVGLDGLPMFHHYSWVRTKEQMLYKVKNWGHNKDKDWTALVEEEFSRPFNGKDFVHGYEYNTIGG